MQQGEVVGTKDLQLTRFTENLQKIISMGRSGITPLICFPESPQGSLAHHWEWLFSQVTMTSFVLPTNYKPKRKGGIARYVLKVKGEVHVAMRTFYRSFLLVS